MLSGRYRLTSKGNAMKLSKVCLLLLSVIGLIGIVKYGSSAVTSAKDYRMVQKLEPLSRSNTFWSNATIALSLERSVTQVALSLADPAPKPFLDLIAEQRSLSDDFFEKAMSELSLVEGFDTETEFKAKAAEYAAMVEGLRTEIDGMLGTSGDNRSETRVKELPYELKDIILQLKTLSSLLVFENQLKSSTVINIAGIRDAAWEMREFGGRARTYYAIATLNGASIPKSSRSLIQADSARAASAWAKIGHLIHASDLDKEFLQSIEVSENRYFTEYLPVLERLDRQMLGQADGAEISYPMEFDAFFELSNEALGGIVQISQDAGEELVQYWSKKSDDYFQSLLIDLGFVIFDLLLLCGALYFVSTRLSSRIEYASNAVDAVANGNLDGEIDHRENDFLEIKTLTSNLEKLIVSAREARKMAATLDDVEKQEKLRIQAEKDREERQALEVEAAREREEVALQEKARLTAFTDFQSDMEHVLGQAAAGNFSNRMSIDLQDQSLLDLAGVINRLLEATDTNITDIVSSIDELAKGNLGIRIEGDREGSFLRMQKDFNDALTTLSHSMSLIMNSGQRVSLTSTELERSSQDMAKRAEDNAATVEQTSTAAEKVAASIRQVVANAKAADEATRRVRQSAQKTKDVSNETENSINAMTDASAQINRVVKVIEDIAFQINLLALNAGVEAARAGDAGRGFSVVASEVRALAQRSQDAVSEISEVIEQNNRSVEVGVEQVGLSRKALENIILEVEVASEQISDIAEAVEKQSIGIEDVNNAVRSIDRSAQTNAASLEEMTASSMALNEEASTLTKALGHFHGVSEHAVPKDQDSLTSEDSVPAEALATRPTKIAVNGGSAVPASDGWDEF